MTRAEDREGATGLPVDSDIEVADSARGLRPVHLRAGYVLLVALGGAVGTGLREGLGLLFPAAAPAFPWTTAAINLAGAFVLGALLETLLRMGPDHGHRRTVRLFVGTGVLGGFTTYSALATDTVLLLRDSVTSGLLYALGTVLLGALATVLGIAVGSLRGRQDDA